MSKPSQAVDPSRQLISVVMPCFNAAQFVNEAIGSVFGQTYQNVELVVVDDGSTDNSANLLSCLAEKYPGRIQLLHTMRVGPYPARNIALHHARGTYIAFLDADDWWAPTTLEMLHDALVQSDADIAYCGWQNVGTGMESPPYVPSAYEEEDAVALFLRTCPWPIHAALMRREVVDRLHGFSERRYASMDYDFWLRALALTRRIKRVPEVLAFYRWHNLGQISAVKWRQVLDALDAQKAFIRTNPHLVRHLSADRLKDLTEGQVLRQAYRAFWKRDLASAQKLFRHSAASRAFRARDMPYIASAMLPARLFNGLVKLADRRKQ